MRLGFTLKRMESFEINSVLCKWRRTSDVNTRQSYILDVLQQHDFHSSERNEQAIINLAKQGLVPRALKHFLHLGRWKQGTSTQLLRANERARHRPPARVSWAERNGRGSAALTWPRSSQLAWRTGTASRHLQEGGRAALTSARQLCVDLKLVDTDYLWSL